MKKIFTFNLRPAFLILFAVFCSGLKAQITTQTFSYSGTIQNFTVPLLCVNTVTIDARGAGGGSVSVSCSAGGGLGARMVGVFTVTPGQVISIMVGQTGYSNGSDAGGGGGSFVATGTVPLIAAGGGGGASNNIGSCGSNLNGLNATITTSATASGNGLVGGGVNGNGGGASTGSGGGGGGFYTNGVGGSGTPSSNGKAFLNGGAGGTGNNNDGGGYGGGGAGWFTGGNGGGGGGYSGGATSGNSPYSAGGGGASYNSGTNQSNTAGFQAGNGLVIISYQLGTPLTTVATSTALCAGNSSTITASGMLTYTWSTGSNASSIVVTPATNTSYTVQGTNSQNCIGNSVVNVTVSPGLPSLSVSSSTTQTCLGKTVSINATGAVTYTISNGVTNGVSFTPTATNVYTVTGQNGCGTATAVTSISVGPLPVSIASSASLVCAGQQALLTTTSAANSFTWYPINSGQSSIAVNPTVSSTYSIAVSDGTCFGTATIAVAANPIPTITSTSSGSLVCYGNSVILSANGGVSYTWNPGNVVGQTVTLTPTSPTLYSVTASNNVGCTSISSQVVVVNPPPTVNVSASDLIVCLGGPSTLSVNGSANTYSWSVGGTANSVVVNPTQLTVYSVVGTNTTTQCSATGTIQVDVFIPVVSITGNTAICSGGSATLLASGADSYTWLPSGLPFSGVTLSPSVTTVYTLSTLTSSNTLICPATNTVQVNVTPSPTVLATSTRTSICKNETTTVTASGASSYTWSVPGASGASASVTSSVVTNLNITCTGSSNGCTGTTSLTIKVNACVGLNEVEEQTAVMNVFPNPNSGAFTIESDADVELAITNNLGQVVKLISLSGTNNDRKVQISGLSSGVYFISGRNGASSFSRKIIVQN